MILKKRLKEFTPDTSQGRMFLKVAGVLVAFAAGYHLLMSFYRGDRSKQWKDYFGEKELNQFMDMSEGALRLAGYL